jgi:hypothetical protein
MIPPPHVAPTPQKRRRYVAYRPQSRPQIDGRIDKAFWSQAPWTEAFVDIEGESRPPPTYRTRAKLLWDDAALYIAAEMQESHVWATLRQRDSIVYHDNDFEVFLSPTGDNHAYYELEVNALNTIFDLFLSKPYRDGGPADHAWDVRGLQSAVHVDGTLNDPRDEDRGWSVELALPWSAFDRHGAVRCPPRDGDHWRLNFSRVQWDHEISDGQYRKVAGRPEHNWVWSPQGVIDMHRPEQWGYLQFSSITAGSGPANFIPDPSESARDALHRVYYAQLEFRHRNGRWASALEELGADAGAPVTLRERPDGWEAAVPFPTNGPACECTIRHDSLIRTSEKPG